MKFYSFHERAMIPVTTFLASDEKFERLKLKFRPTKNQVEYFWSTTFLPIRFLPLFIRAWIFLGKVINLQTGSASNNIVNRNKTGTLISNPTSNQLTKFKKNASSFIVFHQLIWYEQYFTSNLKFDYKLSILSCSECCSCTESCKWNS